MRIHDIAHVVESVARTADGQWRPAPEGVECRFCKSSKMMCRMTPHGGPFGSAVQCNRCGMVESLYTNLTMEGGLTGSSSVGYEPDSEEGY